MINKLSFENIIKSHISTMRDNSTDRMSLGDVFVFFVLPLMFAIPLTYSYALNKDLTNSIITSASIFAGLLLNLLVLIYSLVDKFKQNGNGSVVKRKVLEQTFSNISFCILISVILVVACMLGFRTDDEINKGVTFEKSVADFVVYYLTTMLALHLLMILKRIHLLMESEFPE